MLSTRDGPDIRQYYQLRMDRIWPYYHKWMDRISGSITNSELTGYPVVLSTKDGPDLAVLSTKDGPDIRPYYQLGIDRISGRITN